MHTHTLWAARVAAGTVLPDKRLTARLACVLETFAERPSDAIPQAAGSWGQAQGLYRFLANPRVRPAALHQGLTSDTAQQCLEQRTVLVVQDTTSLNLTGCHVLPELGPIGSGNLAQGVLLHSTLAWQTWPKHPCHQWGRKTTGLGRVPDGVFGRSCTLRYALLYYIL